MDRVKKIKLYVLHHRTICYSFWFTNLIYLTSKYFAYETQVDLGFYAPITLISPNLSICFDLNTLFGKHEIFIFNNHAPHISGMTSKDIFDRVPGVGEIVERCAFRDPLSDQIIVSLNSTECYQLFSVERYRMSSFMCYLFHSNKQQNFSFNALAFSLNEPKLLYNLAIKGRLTAGHAVAPLVHLDELADMDRIYMKEISPSKKDNEMYRLDYHLYEIERLPPPYSTRCGPQPQLRCLYNCLVSEYSKSGIMPYSSVVRETAEMGPIKVAKYYGGEREDQFRARNYKICAKSCPSEACSQKLVITHIFGPFENKYKLAFNVGSYKSPIHLMKYSPAMSLAEYATQLFSLSGIWVGFSVVSLISRRKRFDIINTYKAWIALKARLPCYSSLNSLSRALIEGVSNLQIKREQLKKRKVRRSKRFICLTFKLIILVIFAVQAINLCFTYSKYETLVMYQHSLNPEFSFRLPSTAICVDINEQISPLKIASINEENHEDILSKKNIWINLTLDEIFDKTMGEDILFKCRVKSYDFKDYFRGTFQLKSGEECLKEDFTFYKYYSMWQMCYLFKPKKLPTNLPVVYKQHSFVFTELNSAKLYSLILEPKVANYGKIDLVVYFDSENASYDSGDFRAISPNLAEKRVVLLTYHTIVFSYLPPPYDTRCDPNYPKYKCIDDCRAVKLLQLGRLPFSNLLKERMKVRLVSFKDLKNSTFNEFYRKAENYCHEKCKTSICSGNYTLTYSRHVLDRTNFSIEVVVSVESIPRTRHWTVPRIQFYEFFYQMFCLLAFWLGFSFVGLNFIRNTKEKRFNQAAKVLYCETIKLLLSMRSFPGKIGPFDHKKANALKRNLLIKRVICYSVCVFGMFFHLILPIGDYLSYPTKLLMTILQEKPVPYKLIVCSEGQDLLERGIIFGQNRAASDKYLYDRNLDEIMEEAKKLNQSISACGYWGLSKDKDKTNKMMNVTDRVFFKTNNSSLCEEMFDTNIFLNQGLICFQYRLKRKAEWNLSQMLSSINRAKTVLSVSFNSTLISPRFTLMAHQYVPGDSPTHTSVWSQEIQKKEGQSVFYVSYLAFVVEKLPFPYSDKGFFPPSITHCISLCTNEKMGRFNVRRIALGEKFTSTKILSNSHRESSFVNKLADEIDRECDKRCADKDPFEEMSYSYMVTMVSEPVSNKVSLDGSTRFNLKRTDDPIVAMEFLVSISIFDLIINIGSVISIWFGLSVINIPDLASEDDMEKMYIRTVDNLETTNCILRQTRINRRLTNLRKIRRR